MKKTTFILAAILSCLFLLLTAPAYPADTGKDLVEGIGMLSTEIVKCEMTLCYLCSFYYRDNGMWPKDRQELEAYFKKTDDKNAKEKMEYLSKMASYELTPLENGDLLIEGGFSKELTKDSSAARSFCFSCVAHKTEEGVTFTPSDKSKRSLQLIKKLLKQE